VIQAFSLLDYDGKGQLETKDVWNTLSELGDQPTQTRVNAMFSPVGSQNGVVEFSQFMEVMDPRLNLPNLPPDVVLDAFTELDPSGTGQIDIGELRYVLTGMGDDQLDDEEVDEIIKSLNLDARTIAYRELVEANLSANRDKW